jgi:hypothetical protein
MRVDDSAGKGVKNRDLIEEIHKHLQKHGRKLVIGRYDDDDDDTAHSRNDCHGNKHQNIRSPSSRVLYAACKMCSTGAVLASIQPFVCRKWCTSRRTLAAKIGRADGTTPPTRLPKQQRRLLSNRHRRRRNL